jgi:hypothetical protein
MDSSNRFTHHLVGAKEVLRAHEHAGLEKNRPQNAEIKVSAQPLRAPSMSNRPQLEKGCLNGSDGHTFSGPAVRFDEAD